MRRIIAAARRAGVHLQVSFMHRYFEEVVRTRELLADARLGPVFAIRMRNATPGADWNDWFFFKDRVGGGVVLQLGVHGIDLIRYVIGEIESVTARVANLRRERRLADGRTVKPDNEDHAHAIYRLDGGALASHEISWSEVHGCDRFRLEIYCAEAHCGFARSADRSRSMHRPSLDHGAGFSSSFPAVPWVRLTTLTGSTSCAARSRQTGRRKMDWPRCW